MNRYFFKTSGVAVFGLLLETNQEVFIGSGYSCNKSFGVYINSKHNRTDGGSRITADNLCSIYDIDTQICALNSEEFT